MTTGITLFSIVVLTTGTFVTGSGPHAGSRDDPIARLPFRPSDIARVHGTTVVLFLVMVAALALAIRRDPTGERLRPRMQALGAVVVLQAAIGWTQYFTGVPELLVGMHLAGATALWATVVALALDARERAPVPEGVRV
jgi:cytochrome c oxidase assembly protein subunit 15